MLQSYKDFPDTRVVACSCGASSWSRSASQAQFPSASPPSAAARRHRRRHVIRRGLWPSHGPGRLQPAPRPDTYLPGFSRCHGTVVHHATPILGDDFDPAQRGHEADRTGQRHGYRPIGGGGSGQFPGEVGVSAPYRLAGGPARLRSGTHHSGNKRARCRDGTGAAARRAGERGVEPGRACPVAAPAGKAGLRAHALHWYTRGM